MGHSITEVGICNESLGKLGLKFISDAGPTGLLAESGDITESGLLLKSVYPVVRDAVLSEVAWRFAEERLILEPSAVEPVWGSSSTAYDIRQGDDVGPDEWGYDLAFETHWHGSDIIDSSFGSTLSVSFRLNSFHAFSSNMLLVLDNCLQVFANNQGELIVLKEGSISPNSDLTGHIVKLKTRYNLTVVLDGLGAYTLTLQEQFNHILAQQFVGEYEVRDWQVEMGPCNGFFWSGFRLSSTGALASAWSMTAGSGTTAQDSIGSNTLALTPDTGLEDAGWVRMFIPAVLRVFRVYTDSAGTDPLGQAEWRQEQNTVVADHAGSNLYALATKQITHPDSWPALFSQAVVARLAAELCMALTRDTSLYQLMWGEYASKISLAKAMDGGAGRSEQQISSKLLSSRMGGGGPFRLY